MRVSHFTSARAERELRISPMEQYTVMAFSLLCGREYYPSGNLRFEGTFGINRGYGPNYPRYGKFLSDDGTTTFEGKIQLRFGGVGYPMVVEPKEFGPIPQACRPKVPVLL